MFLQCPDSLNLPTWSFHGFGRFFGFSRHFGGLVGRVRRFLPQIPLSIHSKSIHKTHFYWWKRSSTSHSAGNSYENSRKLKFQNIAGKKIHSYMARFQSPPKRVVPVSCLLGWLQISLKTFCACWQGPKNEGDLFQRVGYFSKIQKSTKCQLSMGESKICTFLDPAKIKLIDMNGS